jgi:hypothetical protein
MPVPHTLHNIPYVTLVVQSSLTLSGTPTIDIHLIVTEPLEIVALGSENQWIQSPV